MNISIIENEEQYIAYLNRMKEIFHAKEGTPESDELDLLANVLEKYEEKHYKIDAPDFTKADFN